MIRREGRGMGERVRDTEEESVLPTGLVLFDMTALTTSQR
jgi:hypothetical protein